MSFTHPTVGASVPGPTNVGTLILEEVLGSGAFGIVFKSRPEQGDMALAVKFVQAGALGSQAERLGLFNEVRAAAEVQHPNVIRMLSHNLESTDFPPYTVSEFADGGRLLDKLEAARLAKTQVPVDVVMSWSQDIASAMEAINAKVLHRDLKPDNILFSRDTLKVADFGLSKLVGSATRSVTFKGGQPILYMAPEAWAGERNDIQIDMYAAGIVLFEIATLSFPYELPRAGASFDEFRKMHLIQASRSARTLRPELPQRLSDVIQRLMSKRPDARYRSWAEIRAALSVTTSATPVSPGGSTVSALVERASRQHDQAVAADLAAKAKAEQEQEDLAVDFSQIDEIASRIGRLVDRFNQETQGPKATFTVGAPASFKLLMPYARKARLEFFSVRPPLTIDSYNVRFAGLVADADGCGFNLLLKRAPGDVHGRWSVCEVELTMFSGQRHKNCDRFGLEAKDIGEIQIGYQATHTIRPRFSDDVDGALEAFVQNLYRNQQSR